MHTITVPGALRVGMRCERRFGTMPFEKLLAPAIYYAENGFPLPERGARYWIGKALLNQPGYKETYMPGGVRRSLAMSSRTPRWRHRCAPLPTNGRDGYYNGTLTETMVELLCVRKEARTRVEDFAEYQPEWVEPISTTYRGWTVYELPPNGQGIAALAMLNIMENFPLADYGHNSAAALHVMIEAKKLAYADMVHYVGDPQFRPVPVKEMLSKDLAAQRAKLIEMNKAACHGCAFGCHRRS